MNDRTLVANEMKKFLGILVLGLMWCNISLAAITISCIDNIKKDYSEKIRYSSVNIILDNNGSVHVTVYATFVKYGDVWGWDDTSEYQKKVKALKTKKEKRKFSDAHYLESNPLKKNPTDGVKDENFTSIEFKAGNKIKTNLILDENQVTELVFGEFYEIDLDEKTVKKFITVTPESKARWNSNWNEEEAQKAGVKRIGAPDLLNHYINCKTSGASGSTGGVASSGSGFFINNKGYFVTNYHVIADCNDKSKITFKEKDVDAKLIAKDQSLDLALLKAKVKPKSFLYLSADLPEKIQTIYVAGYPFGKGLSDDLKITQGIISSLKGFGDNSNEIQIDAAINPGNSGGPIVNDDGELMAVAVSGLAKDLSEGINFGIKASSVKNFLDVNKVKYSTSSLMKFSMSNKKLSDILEESTVYTFCK